MAPADVAFPVDHSANAAGGLPPSRLVVFGILDLGTALLRTSPAAGIDLPLKILVWQDGRGGRVRVKRNSVALLKSRHGLDGTNSDAIESALANFARAAATPASSA